MKKIAAVFLALMLVFGSVAFAEIADPFPDVRGELEALGIVMEDEKYQEVLRDYAWYMGEMEKFGFSADSDRTKEFFAYRMLMYLGIGSYDEAWQWAPSSDQIYVFDAEVFNIEYMYTEFFRGVQAIIPDAAFSDVAEDLSGLDEYLEGERGVSFRCGEKSYSVTLKSYGDWLNTEILDFLNSVLEEQGASGRLHVISDDYDQMVFVIYGSGQRAQAFRCLIGTEEERAGMEKVPFNWIDTLKELWGAMHKR